MIKYHNCANMTKCISTILNIGFKTFCKPPNCFYLSFTQRPNLSGIGVVYKISQKYIKVISYWIWLDSFLCVTGHVPASATSFLPTKPSRFLLGARNIPVRFALLKNKQKKQKNSINALLVDQQNRPISVVSSFFVKRSKGDRIKLIPLICANYIANCAICWDFTPLHVVLFFKGSVFTMIMLILCDHYVCKLMMYFTSFFIHQGIILPQMYTAAVANIFNLGINYLLISVLEFGVV